MEVSAEELANVLRARASLYSLFKHFFLEEPTCDLLKELTQDALLNSIANGYPEANLREAAARFVEEVSKVSCEEELTDIWAEYTRLFIGTPKPVAPPYESVYRKEERLYGDTWQRVRDWMLDDGFALENKTVPEDHVGIELEYMALTSLEAAKAAEGGEVEKLRSLLSRQKEFLEKHLLAWVPQLCRVVEKSADAEIYRALAKLVSAYLEEDEKHLKFLTKLLAELKEEPLA